MAGEKRSYIGLKWDHFQAYETPVLQLYFFHLPGGGVSTFLDFLGRVFFLSDVA